MNTNLKPKLQRFASATAFACPICQENLTLLETNFKCCNRHSFDLAKFGTENHLKEIRQRVQDQLTNKEYSNQDIKEHFQEHFTILSSQSASLTKTITAEQLQALLSMTPLLFHVDQSKIDWSQLTEITIEAEILVGKAF